MRQSQRYPNAFTSLSCRYEHFKNTFVFVGYYWIEQTWSWNLWPSQLLSNHVQVKFIILIIQYGFSYLQGYKFTILQTYWTHFVLAILNQNLFLTCFYVAISLMICEQSLGTIKWTLGVSFPNGLLTLIRTFVNL